MLDFYLKQVDHAILKDSLSKKSISKTLFQK